MADWQLQALCRADPEPETFYPEPSNKRRVLDAKALCVVCPVRRDCAEDAADRLERFGIHGGFLTDDPGEWERLHTYIGRPVPPKRRTAPHAVVCSQCGTEFVARVPALTKCGPCTQGLVPAGPTVARVKQLRDAGWTFAQIASAASCMNTGTVAGLLRPDRKWVTPTTAERVLAIEVTPDQTGEP
ncbi:WhiB family transcriptional regulator [Nocardia africana]|uniref:Transcriptional regulator WhiB n=1 Tax=Nocardia africana TaxID=134964 RepID=A0A378X3Y8_9NOCA|nr:WhiB family transcriptional regulator [Nocardia africana]MCC3311486.1 WhiB family transcriptional regulator [Nocardia africana]SUA47253.1 Transcription factor WhiB [Nocardia africana]